MLVRQARRLFQHACKLGLEHKELALSFRRTTAQRQENNRLSVMFMQVR